MQLRDRFVERDSVDRGVAAFDVSNRALSEIMSREEWERMAVADRLGYADDAISREDR